jgi:hypothetical protein
MEILYCHKCGIRVDLSDQQRGKAVTFDGKTFCPKCSPTDASARPEPRRISSHASIPAAEPKKDRSNKSLQPAERSSKPGTPNENAVSPKRASARHRAGGDKNGVGTGTVVLGVVAVVFIVLGIYFATESTKINAGDADRRRTPNPAPSTGERPHQNTVATPEQHTQTRSAETSAGSSMALAMLSTKTSPEEDRAEKEWPKLFDNIKPEDTQGRIKKLEEYVAKLSPDWNISARARVLLSSLKKNAANPAVVTAPPPAVEKPVLIGRWKLDDAAGDSAADSSGNNAAAKFVNAPERISGGMHFNGKDSDLEVPNSPVFDHLQEGDYSVCAWFKPDQDPAEEADHVHCGYGVVLKPGRHTGLSYYHGGYFSMDYWTEDGQRFFAGSHAFPPNVLYHVCGVVNKKAGETRLYINGILEKTTFWDPNIAPKNYGDEKWHIGCARPDGSEWSWPAKGIIRDVRLYKGVLSDKEIEAIASEKQ